MKGMDDFNADFNPSYYLVGLLLLLQYDYDYNTNSFGMPNRIASPRILSHRIASHRIASHRIALYRIASHPIPFHEPHPPSTNPGGGSGSGSGSGVRSSFGEKPEILWWDLSVWSGQGRGGGGKGEGELLACVSCSPGGAGGGVGGGEEGGGGSTPDPVVGEVGGYVRWVITSEYLFTIKYVSPRPPPPGVKYGALGRG